MPTIRPNALPAVTVAEAADKLIIDRSGAAVRSILIDDAIASRDPFATTPEAVAGVVVNRKMSPATTVSAIDAKLPNTAIGRAVLNAANTGAARTAIGAGDVKSDGSVTVTGDLPFAAGKAPLLASDGTGNQAVRASQLTMLVVNQLGATEVPIASAATTDIGAAASANVLITGTTPITSFGTAANIFRRIRFGGVLTVTHNATTLILPNGHVQTTAGDIADFVSDASGNWRMVNYQRSDAMPGAYKVSFDTYAAMTTAAAAGFIPPTIPVISLNGYYARSDMPRTDYVRFASNPGHPRSFADAWTGFWGIAPPDGAGFNMRQMGARCDLSANDLAAFQDGLLVSAFFGYAPLYVPAPGMQLGTSGVPMANQFVRRTRVYASDPHVLIAMPGNSAISFWMDGASGVTNGGFDNITLWATVDRTTGQALRMDGDLNGQPDEAICRNLRITGVGTWNIGFYAYGADRPQATVDIVSGGTGYTVGNVLTVVGGTGTAATLTVTSVSSGVITGVTYAGYGNYTVRPTNPVSVTGGAGTGATFTLTTYATGIRRLVIDGLFVGACSALGAYFDTIAELHLPRFGIYGTGAGGNVQITSTNSLLATYQVTITGANVAGDLLLDRVIVAHIQGNFGTVSPSANSTRCKGYGAVGAAITDLGVANNFTMLN